MAYEKIITLPEPRRKGSISLEETISRRRSERNFTPRDLSREQISQLLWAAQGITHKEYGYSFRAAPSAGALYPMELYILDKHGLYHYLAEGHRLETVTAKDLRPELAQFSYNQTFIAQAPVTIVIAAVFKRITAKYGERGLRYSYIEAGHIAQNIHLEAVSLGLGSVPVGAYDDARVKRLLVLPNDFEVLYIIPVGYVE